MYDIYLSVQPRKFPEINDLKLSTELSILPTENPGFLGLNIPLEQAAELLGRLEQSGGGGFVVPSAYHQPKITREEAYLIAKGAILQKQKQHFPTYQFEAIQFLGEGAVWWEFAAISEQLIEAGHVPGRVNALVDKLDGHIWTSQEQQRLFGEEYYLEIATDEEPLYILDRLSARFHRDWGKNYSEKNQTLKLSSTLLVGAVKHSFPGFIENKFGFRPTVHLWFRTIPSQENYTSLLKQAVRMALILSFPTRFVLLCKSGQLQEPLILWNSDGMTFGPGWENLWIGSRFVWGF